jgi:hypothetical protein
MHECHACTNAMHTAHHQTACSPARTRRAPECLLLQPGPPASTGIQLRLVAGSCTGRSSLEGAGAAQGHGGASKRNANTARGGTLVHATQAGPGPGSSAFDTLAPKYDAAIGSEETAMGCECGSPSPGPPPEQQPPVGLAGGVGEGGAGEVPGGALGGGPGEVHPIAFARRPIIGLPKGDGATVWPHWSPPPHPFTHPGPPARSRSRPYQRAARCSARSQTGCCAGGCCGTLTATSWRSRRVRTGLRQGFQVLGWAGEGGWGRVGWPARARATCWRCRRVGQGLRQRFQGPGWAGEEGGADGRAGQQGSRWVIGVLGPQGGQERKGGGLRASGGVEGEGGTAGGECGVDGVGQLAQPACPPHACAVQARGATYRTTDWTRSPA